MGDQGGDTRIELMFRLEAALKRIEQLEAALREIANDDDGPITMAKIARAALAPEREK